MVLGDVWRKFSTLDADRWDAEWEGLRPGRTGLVYKAFDERLGGPHLVSGLEYDPNWLTFGGVDYGYANPFAALIGQIQPALNPPQNRSEVPFDLHLIDELYGEEMVFSTHWIPEMLVLQQQYNVALWFVDPSAAGSIAEMREAGLRAVPANWGELAIRTFQHLLLGYLRNGGVVKVDAKLGAFLAEIVQYRYASRKDGNTVSEAPVKKLDHMMDATKYLTSGLLWWWKVQHQETVGMESMPMAGGSRSNSRRTLMSSRTRHVRPRAMLGRPIG
jgi:hypothetical protein